MRVGRLLQREGAIDARLDLPVGDPAEQVAGAALQLVALGHVVEQGRAGEVQRPVPVELLGIERIHRSARLPVEHHRPAPPEAAEAVPEGRPADPVVDDVHPPPLGHVLHRLGEVLLGVDDHVVGAVAAHQLGLLLGAAGGDDLRAEVPADLCQQVADTAGRRVDQRDLPAGQRVGVVREVVRGHALQQRGDRGAHLQPVGDRDHRVGRHDLLLAVGPTLSRVGDPVALGYTVDVGPDRVDHPAGLDPDRRGQLNRVLPVPVVGVDEVQACRLDPDADLPGTRLGDVDLVDLQDLRPADLVDTNGAHRASSRRRLTGPT